MLCVLQGEGGGWDIELGSSSGRRVTKTGTHILPSPQSPSPLQSHTCPPNASEAAVQLPELTAEQLIQSLDEGMQGDMHEPPRPQHSNLAAAQEGVALSPGLDDTAVRPTGFPHSPLSNPAGGLPPSVWQSYSQRQRYQARQQEDESAWPTDSRDLLGENRLGGVPAPDLELEALTAPEDFAAEDLAAEADALLEHLPVQRRGQSGHGPAAIFPGFKVLPANRKARTQLCNICPDSERSSAFPFAGGPLAAMEK